MRHREPKRGRMVWAYQTTTLIERLALEVWDLYVRRPRLGRCVFCGAVYVRRRNEANCRWALWDAESHMALEECATSEMLAEWIAENPVDRDRRNASEFVNALTKRSGASCNEPEATGATRSSSSCSTTGRLSEGNTPNGAGLDRDR